MQKLGPRAYLVLEKKIFKGFIHIWAWQPSQSMDHDHFSNLSFPCLKEAPHEIWATLDQRLQRRSYLKLSTFFHTNIWDPYKCICRQTWPCHKKVKHHFSNFGRPPIPDDLCKDSARRHPLFWRRRFLKVFTIYGHGAHLGHWTATILAIFLSPTLRRLHMKFEQHCPEASEEKSFEILNIFPIQMYGAHTNA